MALQRTRRPRLRSGRSLRSLGSPLNARPLGAVINAMFLTVQVIARATLARMLAAWSLFSIRTKGLDRSTVGGQVAAGADREGISESSEPGDAGRARWRSYPAQSSSVAGLSEIGPFSAGACYLAGSPRDRMSTLSMRCLKCTMIVIAGNRRLTWRCSGLAALAFARAARFARSARR